MNRRMIDLPSLEAQHALNVARWAEACDDPFYARIDGKFEMNRFGKISVMPPPAINHNFRARAIARKLEALLGGQAFNEFPVSTVEGVRVADVVWFSDARFQEVGHEVLSAVTPEICAEVLSPRNSREELAEKRWLYLHANAVEVWECGQEGAMTFYVAADAATPAAGSRICPEFPAAIEW